MVPTAMNIIIHSVGQLLCVCSSVQGQRKRFDLKTQDAVSLATHG